MSVHADEGKEDDKGNRNTGCIGIGVVLDRKDDLTMIWIGYSAVWISTAVATIFAVKYTGSAWCLLALLIPTTIRIKSSPDDKKEEKDDITKEERMEIVRNAMDSSRRTSS